MEVLGVSGSLVPNSSNWAGVSSWLLTHARSTGPSLSNSSCRLGPGFVGGSSCRGDALSLSVRVGPTVSLYVSFLYLSLQLYGWYVGWRLGMGGFLSRAPRHIWTFSCSHECISSSEVTQISPRFVQSRYNGKSSSLCLLSTVAGPHPIRSAITLNV